MSFLRNIGAYWTHFHIFRIYVFVQILWHLNNQNFATAYVTPMASCTVETEIPDFTASRRTIFVALLW